MTDPNLPTDRGPRSMKPARPSRARRAGRVLVPLLVAGSVFGGALAAARSNASASDAAPDLGNIQPIDYKEECVSEGCDKEELQELWNSMQSECGSEVCWTEEVFELSGGPHYQYDPYTNGSQIPALMTAFRTKLNKRFEDPKMKLGPTDDVWHDIVQFLDGKVIKTPKVSCDPYCG
jgi:hypothetical protein